MSISNTEKTKPKDEGSNHPKHIIDKNDDKDDINSNTIKPRLSQLLADAHENILDIKSLLIVLMSMSLAIFLSFVDQTGITIALPFIADDLNAHETIGWAGTSMLISTTVFMVLFGRFSDIFSRKYVLVGCMIILSFSDLACGFSQTAYQLYIFRGFAGIGNGGITSLTMMITSDVVSLEERGKYQGVLGSFVGLGNAIGPFIASAFIEKSSWRKYFWTLCPLMFLAIGIVIWLVPHTTHEDKIKEKLLQIDYYGFITSSIAIIFLLIPISGGGSTFPWDSGLSISFLTIGGTFFVIFLMIEKYLSKLPMIPLHLFVTNWSLTCLLLQNFFVGINYYSMIYYLPYYLQVIRGFSVIKSSCFMLTTVITQSFTSIITGQIISRSGHYLGVIYYGYGAWTLGTGLLLLWGTNTHPVTIIWAQICLGTGVGSIFQPSLVAAQAQCYKKDRSIVISTRNTIRCLGGALGLAICATIIANNYLSILKSKGLNLFTVAQINALKTNIYSKPTLTGYTDAQVKFLRDSYMKSLRKVFYLFLGSMGVCLLSMVVVKDSGTSPLDSKIEKVEKKGIV